MDVPIMPEQAQTDREIVAVGLDLSMTDTGIAAVLSDGTILTDHITSKGRKDATVAEKADRFLHLVDLITGHPLIPIMPVSIVVEGPSYASVGSAAHDIAGFWWLVVTRLIGLGTLHIATPATLKKYATGKGNASKDEVVAAVVRRYPQADVTNNNVADAVVLAAIGARHVGHSVDELTQQRADAFAKVRWAA